MDAVPQQQPHQQPHQQQPQAQPHPQRQRQPLQHLVENPALRLRLELWKSEEEVVNQRIERKEVRLIDTKNEIYQLLGLYFVFQGVIFTALAQAQNHISWGIPLALSLLASAATILAAFIKLSDCSTLQRQIELEKHDSKALYIACSELIANPAYDPFDVKLQPGFRSRSARRPLAAHKSFAREFWDRHMRGYGASLIAILLVFSALMAYSCKVILGGQSCGGSNK